MLSTPPIRTAICPIFVSLCLPGFQALKKGKPGQALTFGIAVRLPFVLQYASYMYFSTPSHLQGNVFEQAFRGVFQGVAFTGVQVLSEKRLISLNERF